MQVSFTVQRSHLTDLKIDTTQRPHITTFHIWAFISVYCRYTRSYLLIFDKVSSIMWSYLQEVWCIAPPVIGTPALSPKQIFLQAWWGVKLQWREKQHVQPANKASSAWKQHSRGDIREGEAFKEGQTQNKITSGYSITLQFRSVRQESSWSRCGLVKWGKRLSIKCFYC